MDAGETIILIAEEDPLLLEITSFRLELLGYRVTQHHTAAAALEWLAKNVAQMIIVGATSDVGPIDLLNRLGDDPRTSNVPRILLAFDSDLDQVQRAYAAGADEYVLLPFDPLILQKKVQGLLTAAAAASA